MFGFRKSANHLIATDYFRGSVNITEAMKNNKLYSGSEAKFGVTYAFTDYILKQQKLDRLNVQSELIACRFIKYLGGNVQEVKPGIYQGKQVALCRDFTKTRKLRTLGSISSTGRDGDNTSLYNIDTVINELSKVPDINIDKAISDFYKMLIFDAIIGNSDRHRSNWGFVKSKTGLMEFSPIFDCDASLFPKNTNYIIDSEWMEKRIFDYPHSKLKYSDESALSTLSSSASLNSASSDSGNFNDDVVTVNENGNKNTFYELLQNVEFPKKVKEWIGGMDVLNAMNRTCQDYGLNGLKASYYRTIVFYRFECLIKKSDFCWKGMI